MKSLNKALILGMAITCGALTGCLSSGDSATGPDNSSALRLQGAAAGDSTGGVAKVDVCHIPPGNPANMHTITVGSPAVRAHLAHGDKLGACTEVPPDTIPPVTPPTDSVPPVGGNT